jgi:hypothetical protein
MQENIFSSNLNSTQPQCSYCWIFIWLLISTFLDLKHMSYWLLWDQKVQWLVEKSLPWFPVQPTKLKELALISSATNQGAPLQIGIRIEPTLCLNCHEFAIYSLLTLLAVYLFIFTFLILGKKWIRMDRCIGGYVSGTTGGMEILTQKPHILASTWNGAMVFIDNINSQAVCLITRQDWSIHSAWFHHRQLIFQKKIVPLIEFGMQTVASLLTVSPFRAGVSGWC